MASVTHNTPGITENVKTFYEKCSPSLRDRGNGNVHIVKQYTQTDNYGFRIAQAEIL